MDKVVFDLDKGNIYFFNFLFISPGVGLKNVWKKPFCWFKGNRQNVPRLFTKQTLKREILELGS